MTIFSRYSSFLRVLSPHRGRFPHKRGHTLTAYSSKSLMSTASSSSDDEFSAYNFSEFTEEDLRRIDTDVAHILGGPQLTIQIDACQTGKGLSDTIVSQTPHARPRSVLNMSSPIAKYRKRGVLTVTDLASLAWCEVQFDYGLRQRRNQPIATRPESFISAKGKEIFVAKEVAHKNDVRTEKGKALHKILEREVKARELEVEVSSEEEHWALRLLNMLISLRVISLHGYTRELPVFGVLHDEVVVGIIDEVVVKTGRPITPQKRLSTSPTGPKPKKLRGSLSPSQHLVTEYFPNTTPLDPPAPVGPDQPIERDSTLDASPAPTSPPRRLLHILDVKTRSTNSLPEDRATLPSRIQLMLYYRLLKDLTSLSSPFDFGAFWQRVGVDPTKTLSSKFLLHTGLLLDNTWHNACLHDFSTAFIELVESLDISCVDTELELMYRRTQVGERKKFTRPESSSLEAIKASVVHTRNLEEPATQSSSIQIVVQPDSAPSIDTNSPLPIGIKLFEYDEEMLDRYITHVLKWWRGERKPQGVSLEDSWRCRTCEYESNCEWREEKALEEQERLKPR